MQKDYAIKYKHLLVHRVIIYVSSCRSTQFFPQAIQPLQVHTQKAIPSGDAAVTLLSLQEAVVHEGSPTASTPIIKKDPLTPPSCGKLTNEEPDSSTSTCTNTSTDQGYISRESVSLAPEEYDFAETPHGQTTPFSIYPNPRPHFSHASCLPGYAPVSYSSNPTLLHTQPYFRGLETFPRNNSCHICGKTYARQSTLKTHLRTHNGEKPYQCSICQKSFTQAANLTAHLRTHSGEKPFKCPVCNRGFSQSSSVTTHMRTHSGERPYKCNVCGKGFADSSTLTKHYRTHTGEKPYQCKICDARFSQSGNLNRHMRTHRNHFPTRSQ